MSVNVSTGSNAQIASLDLSPTDTSPVDAAVANYEAVYESALQSIQQMLQQVFAQDGVTDTGSVDSGDQSDSGMTAQSAAGALAGYMQQNGINTLDPNQLYQMAYNPAAGTPSAVTDAAKFMLENPDTFNQIETHDVSGADGIAGANDFDWAAQGGLSDASNTGDTAILDDASSFEDSADESSEPMDAQSASGALAAYMNTQSIWSLDPNQLYQMAYNPSASTSSEVSDAAKFMLENPDTFNQIETHDVPGADGIAGANDFDWAAQGGLDNA
uniref:hypothetical protein n=1 Tax=Trinickia acidisoli TaxID=2767482 RepID=UPI001A8FD9BE|nr:hypothetical protein [Trinickia acidisoli]